MKKAFRILAAIMSFALMLTCVQVNPQSVSAATAKVTKITLDKTKATLYVKQSTTLKVKKVTPGKASKSVTWKSSNPKVATVNSKGKVTAKKAGSVTITATSKSNKKVKATCKVTVKNPTISFSSKTVKANINQGITLKPIVKGYSSKVTYSMSSKDKKIATVSKSGKVKFKKTGTVTVTASANGKKAKIKVTGVKSSLSTVGAKSATIWSSGSKNTAQFKVKTTGASKTVTWKSSNTKVATVSKTGKVYGKKAGKATISASANGRTAKFTVTVKGTSLKLSKKDAKVYVGQSVKLTASTVGASKTITWSTNSKNIAVKNGVVTTKRAGTYYVYASANGLKATCKVVVVAPTTKLSKTTVSLYEGQSTKLTATVAGPSKTVTWTTSSKNITVKNGEVKAVKAGTYYVYATANGVKATCKVVVVAPTIELNKTSVTLEEGASTKLTATVTGPSKTVTWKTNSANITVNNGEVKALKAGTYKVTATANGVTATCTVTVTAKQDEEPQPTPPVQVDQEEIKPTDTTLGDEAAKTYTVSKKAKSIKVVNRNYSYENTVEKAQQVQAKLVQIAADCNGDVAKMFNRVANAGKTFTVAGVNVTVNASAENTKNITVSGANEKVNGTYDVSIAKDGSEYKVTVKNATTAKTATFSVTYANGIYTVVTKVKQTTFTAAVSDDLTKATVTSETALLTGGSKTSVVAIYEEDADNYALTYNRDFLDNHNGAFITTYGYDLAKVIDETKITAFYK